MRDDNGNPIGSFLGGFVAAYAASYAATKVVANMDKQVERRVKSRSPKVVDAKMHHVDPDSLVLHTEEEMDEIERREDEEMKTMEKPTESKTKIKGECGKYLRNENIVCTDERVNALMDRFCK